MNRRNRTIVVVSLALLLAALASFGVLRAIQSIPVREVPIATKHIVVAKGMTPVGTLLTGDQVQLIAWPEQSPVPGSFSTVEDVVGRGVIAPLVQNEPVTETKLAPREAGAGVQAGITAGMRAMSVRVNDVIGVAGFVGPGSRVDVLVTLRNTNEPVSRVVLNNIQVLAAGTQTDIEQSRGGKAIQTNVVTLMLTPQEAERLALAQDQGSIVLALRNPLDVVAVDTRGVRVGGLLASPDAPPVARVVQGQRRVVAPPPPPAPPKPYTVEAIRGAKRAEETIQQ